MNTPRRPSKTALSLGLSALLALGVPDFAAAQWIYLDAGGKKVYSDVAPPAGTATDKILRRPGQAKGELPTTGAKRIKSEASAPTASATASAPAKAASGKDPELERRRKAEEDGKSAKAKAEDDARRAANAKNCEASRNNLRNAQSGLRLSKINDKGETVVLDEAGVRTEIAAAQQAVAENCK